MPQHRAVIVGAGRMAGTIDDEVRGFPGQLLPYSHAAGYAVVPDVDVVAVSDVNEPRMDQAAKMIIDGPRPHACDKVLDYRRILERKDVDAVLIATTQHWHGLPFIHAAQAGKHIYVEKPLSHTVVEGRAMVDAARRSGVIAMMGTQQRGYPHYLQSRVRAP